MWGPLTVLSNSILFIFLSRYSLNGQVKAMPVPYIPTDTRVLSTATSSNQIFIFRILNASSMKRSDGIVCSGFPANYIQLLSKGCFTMTRLVSFITDIQRCNFQINVSCWRDCQPTLQIGNGMTKRCDTKYQLENLTR